MESKLQEICGLLKPSCGFLSVEIILAEDEGVELSCAVAALQYIAELVTPYRLIYKPKVVY